eukprot:1046578-Lingulodinium_polyedra.AAC.1
MFGSRPGLERKDTTPGPVWQVMFSIRYAVRSLQLRYMHAQYVSDARRPVQRSSWVPGPSRQASFGRSSLHPRNVFLADGLQVRQAPLLLARGRDARGGQGGRQGPALAALAVA